MKSINKFFNLHKSYRYHYRMVGLLPPLFVVVCSIFLLGAYVSGAVFGDNSQQSPLGSYVLIVIIGFIGALRLFKPGHISKRQLADRQKAIKNLQSHSPIDEPGGKSQKMLSLDTMNEVYGGLYTSGVGVINSLSGTGWKFGDLCYSRESVFFKSSRSEDRYFSCIEVNLPRKLPATLFSSKRNSHNFAFLLRKQQTEKAKLEAYVEKYFDIYFPIHYHIDAISIMSPEVIEVLLKLKDFDIEIVDDKLILYGPLIEVQSIFEVVNVAIEMATKLSDHVVSYIDERVEDQTGAVSIVGSRLRRSDNLMLAYFALGVAMGIFAIFILITGEAGKYDLIDQVALLVGGIFFIFFGAILFIKTLISRKRREQKLDKIQEEFEKKRDLKRRS